MKRYSHVHCTDKYSEHSPTIRYVWPTGWVFVYELSGFGFQSSCSHLNFRFRGCLEQGAPRCWRNDRVQIQSEAGTSHDQMHQTYKYSEHSPIIWSVRPNGWGIVYELSRSCFESSCSHFNFSYRVFLEQRVPWHWRNYRVWIHCKRLCDMIKAYSQMDRTYKYSEHSSIIWSVWPNGWVLVYKLRVCGFESSCSHLNFRFLACFIIRVLWHSGNYRVWINSKTHALHDKNLQSNRPYR